MKITTRKYFKSKGISLLEVMLSLAIIAIILVMATRYFGLASRGAKVNDGTQQINEVRQGLTRWLQDNGTLSGATLPGMATAGYITSQTGSGQGPWGPGTITISPGTTNASISLSTGGDAAGCENLAKRFINIGGSCGTGGVVTIPNGVQ